jgi:CubicO group peptidase (beta-lactamase class C family)
VRGYLLATPDIRAAISIDPIFRPVAGHARQGVDLLDTTLAAERIDGAAGIVSTLPDLYRFAAALFRGQLLAGPSQRLLTSAAQGMDREAVDSTRVWALQSIRRPFGVLLYKDGDGPGGVNALMAYAPARDQIFLGFVNCFGHFDEVERMMDGVIGPLLKDDVAPALPAR